MPGLKVSKNPMLFLSFLLGATLCNNAGAQQLPTNHQSHEGAHKLTIVMGHAQITKAHGEPHETGSTLGALVFHYDYLFGKKWGLGSHNDVIFEEHAVLQVQNGEEHLVKEMEMPFATKIVGSFKPGKHTAFMLGLGNEINSTGHHLLSTVGVDYGWELAHGWEIGGELTFDLVHHASNNWVLGLGIGKTFHMGRHKRH